MNGSESLWNEEELLTQMEEMQDQIESQENTISSLTSTMDSMKESEKADKEKIRQLSSEVSDLKSALLMAKKKIHEQSEQIVKLNGSDLLVQENENLRNSISAVRAEISSVKEEYKKKEHALEVEKKRVTDAAKLVKEKMDNEDRLIVDEATRIAGKQLKRYYAKYKKDTDDPARGFLLCKRKLKRRIWIGLLAGIAASLVSILVILAVHPEIREALLLLVS